MTFLRSLFVEVHPAAAAGLFFVAGAAIGTLLTIWTVRLTDERLPASLLSRENGSPWWHHLPLLGFFLSRGRRSWRGIPVAGYGLFLEITTGLLFAGFVYAYTSAYCQSVVEVQPDESWKYGRVFYHLLLIAFLVAATGTDLRNYTIPDSVTVPAILLGAAAAALAGDLQMIHLWVDWNEAVEGLRGPYIPEWIKQHRHLHGLAWSLAGAAAGALITWNVRLVSSWILGRESLGLGDVTLMAMIGSFLGWQPIVFTFFFAPFCGLLVGLLVRVLFKRTFIPYGPFLATGAVVVLFGWRWIWTAEIPFSEQERHAVNKLFADPVGLGILYAFTLLALAAILGLKRLYEAIPVKRRSADLPEGPSSD